MKRLRETIYMLLLLPLMVAGVVACAPAEPEYSRKYQCYFIFDGKIHNNSILKGVLNPLAPGYFAMVTKQGGTASSIGLSISLYGGQPETMKMTTAEELRYPCILGAGNSLVIGCSSFNNGAIYAYDRQCPNCLETNYPMTSYALSWTNNGQGLKCNTCGRTYDLNNGGIVTGGASGMKLIRYRASYDGNVLVVSDK